MLQFREIPAADVRAGDLLLLCRHEPPLTRRIRAVTRADGQMVLTMEGLPAGTPPWRAQPHVTMRVVDETAG